MNADQESKIRALAEEEKRAAEGCRNQTNTAGMLGGAAMMAEPSLRERIHSQRHHAQVQSRKVEQLAELEYLLDKHPDVARILELMEAARF